MVWRIVNWGGGMATKKAETKEKVAEKGEEEEAGEVAEQEEQEE